ncbi:MAG: patatin-like phospholipase family protein [Myxococcaceae bacterium]|nr:patatin-like phospholipase family protein [Myxococcaceae bacterium]
MDSRPDASPSPPIVDRLRGKRFGVVLSAGFFGFYGHAGFLKALHAAGLEPSAWAGSSAGGLIAAHAAAGSSVGEIEALLRKQTRRHFWDPDPVGTLIDAVKGGHAFSGLLKGDRFRALIESSLPVRRFEDCRTPLLLVATNLSRARSQVFTSGELSPAVHATCAYPGLFRAVRLGGDLFWDGGIVDKAPLVALAESEPGGNLDAFLVHYLPSRTRDRLSGALAYAQGLDAGLTAGRHEHFVLQLKVMQARGVPVYVITSRLPPVSPKTMEREGMLAMDAAEASVARALSSAPVPFV